MKRIALILALVLTAVYAVWWSWFALGRHAKTNSTRFDLGNAEQIIWNATQGRWFESTDPYGTATVSRLAYHADFFLLAIVPIYALAPTPDTLLLFQTLALASAIMAVFLISRLLLKHDWWALGLAGVFAVTPALHWMNIFDFHAVAFATPLILWSLYAALSQRYGWMLVAAYLAMLTKEEIGLALIPIAALLWFWQRKKKWALIMLLPSVWAIVMLLVALPAAQSAIADSANVYRSQFGDSAGQVVKNLLSHPRQAFTLVTSSTTQHYVLQLLVPFGWLPLGHWFALGALPDLAINTISSKVPQQTIFFHYTAGILPWLAVGMIGVVAWVRRRWPIKITSAVLGGWIVIWAVVGAWLYGPLPGAQLDHTRFVTWKNIYAEPTARWSEKIDNAAAVTVTNNLGAHFAQREHLYSFPLGIDQSDYAVILEGHALPEVATQADVNQAILELQSDSAWELEEQFEDFWVFRRS